MSNVYNSQGWDLIAAATQKNVNTQLQAIPSVSVSDTVTVDFGGFQIPISLNVILGSPQVSVLPGSNTQLDVIFPVSGTVAIGSDSYTLPANQTFVIQTELTQIEATLKSTDPTLTNYDLVFDFLNSGAIANMTWGEPNGPGAGDLTTLIQAMLTAVQKWIGNSNSYKVASFSLTTAEVTEYKALIPHFAAFAMVQDTTNVDRSNILVLMLTTSTTPGATIFAAPILPADQDFAVLMSNHLFLSAYVLPNVITQIQAMAKSPDQVPSQLTLAEVDTNNNLYQIQNTSQIDLNKDHDPWISTFQTSIDTSAQAVLFYVEAKADITFLNIHVDATDSSWHQFSVDNSGTVSLPQTKEVKNQGTSVDWWEWLLAFVTGAIIAAALAIAAAVVDVKDPGLGGTFANVGQNLVHWPNQKKATLKQIISPNHVVLFLDVNFSA